MEIKTAPHRSATPATGADSAANASCGGCCGVSSGQQPVPGLPVTAAAAAWPVSEIGGLVLFRIANMDCASEEAEIRRVLEPVEGIVRLQFQLSARILGIQATTPQQLDRALSAIRAAGFKPEPLPRPAAGEASSSGHEEAASTGKARLATALVLAVAAEAIDYFAGDVGVWRVAGMAIALAAIALSGLETYTKGWASLRRGKLTITALMSVAVTGAFLIGEWPEAAMVMALYAISELIEARSVDRARNAIQTLMALAPEQAQVRQPDGAWSTVAASAAAVGDIVRVRPGERIPLDGRISTGATAINQAPVTGESIPVDKSVGDQVFAGTINDTHEIEVAVSAPATNSTLARIIQAVEQAQSSRAPTQRFVDRFAAVYTPAVFAVAALTALALPSLTGVSWTDGLYKALVLLVIACPCALVISTPVTVVSALAAAARRGILIKGGVYLEQAKNLKAVALDKTGTVTEGKPRLVDWQAMDASDDRERFGRLAASLAARSDHPVSKAIASGLESSVLDVSDFQALAGRGVAGVIDGEHFALGNQRLAQERGLGSNALEQQLLAHEQQGRTVTVLMSQTKVLALFSVADTIKSTSRQAIDELKAMGVVPVLLTGDNEATAQSVARQAGIEQARGNLLPQDKQVAVEDLERRLGATAMTGDGINDAPALAKASIGIAMGAAGTDTAMEAADVVVMNDDLRRIPETIRLSRRTSAVLRQNIALALGIKAVFFVAVLFGSATMWMAVFADVGASLLVVGNGLRLLKGAGKGPTA